MKRALAIILTIVLTLSLCACGKKPEPRPEPTNLAEILVQDFQDQVWANKDIPLEDLANELMKNPALNLDGMVTPVEPGLLTGFGNTEITGFSEGVMFGPMIGVIPFVGYVFRLAEGTDGAAFQKVLEDNADLRWNICTEADVMAVRQEENLVFFVMCPAAIEG